MKICVYAFANTAYFFDSLIEESRARGDAVEWSAILPRWHHQRRFQSLLMPEKVLYLYEQYDEVYASRDAGAAFGLAAEGDNELLCLLKDKAGYRFLDTQEQLRRAGAVVQIYRTFLERERPDYMLFPDLEVVDGFLLLSLCKSMGITPIYYVGMRTLGGGFFSTDAEEGLPPYFGPYAEQDVGRARDFLAHFLTGKPFSFEPQVSSAPANLVSAPLWKRIPQALHMHFRYERRYAGEDGWVNRIKANVAQHLNAYRAWHFRAFQLCWFDLRDDAAALPVKYVLYALQYTPESSINGLEPYYVDQMRAIDLLLAGMPSDFRLVVKEHPAIMGVRAAAFYRRLRRKPGVVLAAPGLSTRRLMAEASVVASVTGTIGFESYLLGKPCLLFGRNFFSHLCALGEGPSSIRRVMSRLFEDFQAPSEDARALELARLLHVRYPILLSDPVAQPDVLTRRNVQAFIAALHDHIGRLEKFGLEPRG
jgi:hypothetical protein